MKTPRLLILWLFLSIFWTSKAQERDELQMYYGTSSAEIGRTHPLLCSAWIEVTAYNETGVEYKHVVSKNFGWNFGLNYAWADILIHYPSPPGYSSIPPKYENFALISLPVTAEYRFWRYFYAKAGINIDLQLTENSFDKQTGVGLIGGAGIKYGIKNFVFYVFPHYKYHLLIPFDKEEPLVENAKYDPLHLKEFGIQFGLSYRFENFKLFGNKKETQEKKHSPTFFDKK